MLAKIMRWIRWTFFAAWMLFGGFGFGQSQTSLSIDKQAGTVSVDGTSVDVRTSIRAIADELELNVVIPQAEDLGTADVRLKDIPWPRVFQILLAESGHVMTKLDGSIFRIQPNEAAARSVHKTRVFRVAHRDAAGLKSFIETLLHSPNAQVIVDERSNTLVVRAAPAELDRVQAVLETHDTGKTPEN